MRTLRRSIEDVLAGQADSLRQMAFVTGPRQVGKTTACRAFRPGCRYLDWDDQDARRTILAGPAAVAAACGLDRIAAAIPVVVLDELHKYRRWKRFLKGFFDTWGDRVRIVVTGSSRLDLYRRGGDSLMGRYFLHRMHPLSVGELLRPAVLEAPTAPPGPIPESDWRALLEHGGFPEPFLRRDRRFTLRWQALREKQLVREDVRDTSRVQELDQLEVFVRLLAAGSGHQLGYTRLSREVQVTVDTVRRWLVLLESLHHGFRVRPWHRNVARSLRKEPKWYLRDWAAVEDPGARAETFAACHLLKAVESWEDAGLGRFELRYLRDKERREADCLVVRDGKPWFLVEVKAGEERISPSLLHFQRQTGAAHAFQAVLEAPFVAADCFRRGDPCIVPARTLLSQLP